MKRARGSDAALPSSKGQSHSIRRVTDEVLVDNAIASSTPPSPTINRMQHRALKLPSDLSTASLQTRTTTRPTRVMIQ